MTHRAELAEERAPLVVPRSPGRADSRRVFVAVVAALLLGGVGVFMFDAAAYWEANLALVTGGPPPSAGHFALRGVLTSVTFAPAALVASIGGVAVAGFAVLVQNSLLIAWVAAYLIPTALAPWRTLGTRGRWAAGALCWLALQGFAPYPLVDLYAVVAVLAGLVLLGRTSPLALLGSGASLGFAVNLRPAYLPVVALLAVVTLVTRRWRSIYVAAGAAVLLAPQVIYNYLNYHSFSLSPMATSRLVALQAGYAAYAVRYDTAPGRGVSPQQFFCSPEMARSLDSLPTSTTELLTTFLKNLPESALFALEKVAAALHWPLSIPYLVSNPGVDALFAATITLIALAGCGFLIVMPIARRFSTTRVTWEAWGRVTVVAAASIVTLAGSATEARFALPLVLFGVIGVAALVDTGMSRLARRPWVAGAAVLAGLLVIGLGYAGLAHPAPPGDVTPEICAQA